MTVFKSYFKVLKSSKVSIAIYLLISVTVILILTGMGSNKDEAYSAVSHGLVIVDNDKSEVSKVLIDFLGEFNEIKEKDYSKEEIVDLMYYTKISNYIVIPEGFGDSVLNGDGSLKIDSTKDAGSRMGYLIDAEIENYINLFKNYYKGGFSIEEAAKLSTESYKNNSSVSIMEKSDNEEVFFNAFVMLPYGLMTIILSAILPVILKMGSQKIDKRSNISSMPRVKRQFMITAATVVVTVFVDIFLIVIGSVIDKESFTDRWWLMVSNICVLSITMTMFVIAVSNLGLKERTIPAFTNVISLSFCFLGGIFVPLEMLGGMAKTLGRFVPTFWYSRAVEKIQNGGGFGDIANFLLIQLLFGVMVMTVGLAIGKAKMQKSE